MQVALLINFLTISFNARLKVRTSVDLGLALMVVVGFLALKAIAVRIAPVPVAL